MVDIFSPKNYIKPGIYDDPAMQQAADFLDDDVVAELCIRVRRNGAMSVAGCIDEENYAIACLQTAIQTIKDHNMRRRMALLTGDNKIDLIIPQYDTPLR